MRIITPVLLAGGVGTRLWPLSRRSYPKQFARLTSDESLFQQSAKRLSGSFDVNEAYCFGKPLCLTTDAYRFIIGEQLQAVGIDPGPILIEPAAKNTAPAVLAACLYSLQQNPDAVLLVAPSDHVIPDTEEFHASIASGMEAVLGGTIAVFGIQPDRPETGYGYLELAASSEPDLASPASQKRKSVTLERFVEKPDRATAEAMLDTGRFLWNAGIFLFRADVMLEAFHQHAEALVAPVSRAVEDGHADLGFWRLDPEAWESCDNISIDYAVMERAENLAVVPYDGGWSDLGDWQAIWQATDKDSLGVGLRGPATAFECRNVLLHAESSAQQLVGLGLEDIIAIAMPDAVLVARQDKAQEVGALVSMLKQQEVVQAETLLKDYRPWGWFESLILVAGSDNLSDGFQVKRIHVKPGGMLSLQSHRHRSEHWVVVQGLARVTVNDRVSQLARGESVFIPQTALHRLENPHDEALVLIEIQTGTYLGEDDIIRHSDIYDRS